MKFVTYGIMYTVLFASLEVQAGNWDRWRGENGGGVVAEGQAPTRWSAVDNVRWSTPISGRGHSSPIVHGDRVFVTSATPLDLQGRARQYLLILDRDTGDVLHRVLIAREIPGPKQEKNSYATPTPVTDGKHVYAMFGKWGVVCSDYDGKIVWTSYPGDFECIHGEASSPVIYKDLLLLSRDQDGQSYLVALDRATGKIRWKRYRHTERSFTTPIVIQVNGRDQMVVSGGKHVAGYDPLTGDWIWQASNVVYKWVVPSVVSGDGLVYVSAGVSGKSVLAIDPTGEGDITQSNVVWTNSRGGPKITSPIYHEGILYLLGDRGIMTTMEAKTGKTIWQERLDRNVSFASSPIIVGEHVYSVSDNGTTYVTKVGRTFEIVAKNHLDETTYASPAFSDGQLFIRTERQLYCIENAASE